MLVKVINLLLLIFIYFSAAREADVFNATAYALQFLHLKHIDILAETTATEVLNIFYEHGITTSLYKMNNISALVPSKHTGIHIPSKKVILWIIDPRLLEGSVKLLKSNLIISIKTNVIALSSVDVTETLLKHSTEGDSIALIHELPDVKSSSDYVSHPLTDMVVEILDALSVFADFKYTLQALPILHGSKTSNGSWNGLVGLLSTKEADIGASFLSWTDEREAIIDFTRAFKVDDLTFVSKSPQPIDRFGAILRLFHYKLWSLYIFTGLVSGVITAATWWIYVRKIHFSKTSLQVMVNWSFWATLGSGMYQGAQSVPKVTATRISYASWLCICIVVLSVYCGNIRAFLSFIERQRPIETIADALDTEAHILYFPGSSMSLFLKESNYEAYREAWKRNLENNLGDNVRISDYFVEATNGHIFLGERLWLSFYSQYLFKGISTCPLHVSKERMREEFLCFGLQKGSPLIIPLSEGIKRLTEAGLILFWEKMYFFKFLGQGPCKLETTTLQESGDVTPLTLNDVGVVFVILLCGYAVALATLFFEILMKNGIRNRSESQRL
ncbi:glutamate receptor-like isoform X2 [Tachypleus tridentatus]|uniref:glutamate receptor-like isoform X2 n=1 Tax=Tachypleus tridentatus TaxID=6853 RepID=UPI003FD3BBC1